MSTFYLRHWYIDNAEKMPDDAAMKTVSAVKYYGSRYRIALALQISRQAVCKWGDVVPSQQALRLEDLTDGKLKVIRSLYKLGAAK